MQNQPSEEPGAGLVLGLIWGPGFTEYFFLKISVASYFLAAKCRDMGLGQLYVVKDASSFHFIYVF